MNIGALERLGYLIEECGDVIASAGDCLRFGFESMSTDSSTGQEKSSKEWILEDLQDLKAAINCFELGLEEEG